MKKWLYRIIKTVAALVLILLLILATVIFFDKIDKAVVEKYVGNDNLPTIKSDWKGTPVDRKDRFVNVEFPFLPSTLNLLKWQLGAKPQKAEKQNDAARLEVRDPNDFLKSGEDGILWLGHAAFLIRLNGKNILIDPVFGKPSFIRMLVEVPSPIENLPEIDFILISHDHRDHCDEATIRRLTEKFPRAKILAGLRMEELLRDWTKPETEIQSAGWFQQFALPDENVKIFFLPVRHWSRRGLFDTNHRLWGGFVVQGAGKTVYFSGDTGYGSHYRELAELFPQIDYFIVGIGAYSPRWFMEPNHNTPEEAFQGFKDSKARFLIPMHFATFDLSDEPASEPLRLLTESAGREDAADKIKNLQINEYLSFDE